MRKGEEMVKSKMKVLLVEDSPSDAKLIKHELGEDQGYSFEVIWVSRVDKAIAELKRQQFDVALLDLTLPDSDGLATFTRIHSVCPQQLPIIILTGTGNEQIGIEAISLGAQDYLVKCSADSKSITRAIRYSMERKMAAEALRKSEEHFRSIIQNSSDIIIIVNKLGTITYVSPSIERFFGYKTTELIGKDAFSFIAAADIDKAIHDFGEAILTKGIDITNSFRIKHKNGSEIVVEGLGKNLLDDPAVEGFVMNVRDVTERKRIEDTQLFLLQCGWSDPNEYFFASLARYLAETLAVDFVCIDRLEEDCLAARTVAVYFDGKFEDNISYALKDTPCGDVAGKMICSFPRDVRHLFPRDAVLQEMKAESYVGTTLWSSKGKPIGLIAIISRKPMINIKLAESVLQLAAIRAAGELERKQAEEELRQSEHRLSRAQEIAHLGSWELDMENKRLFWSDEVYRIFGLQPQEFDATYEAFIEAVHPDDRAAVDATYSSSVRECRGTYEIEHRVVRKSTGEIRTVHERCENIPDASGQIIRSVGMVHDITKRKKMEEALQKSHDELELRVEERTEELQAALSEIKAIKEKLEIENVYFRQENKMKHQFENIIGQSDGLKYVLYRAEQVAPTNTTVLILGETGTGKELIAAAIHNMSPRKERPLITVNCAALPGNLIESELFGREKGAFTGADVRRIGRFEVANGSTLCLDEIGELPLELQAKLLRVIQHNEFERLGSSHTVKVDVRIVATTNRNLEEEVRKGRFRQDLYYRLNVFPITVPPLRQRKDDIPLMVQAFIERYSRKLGKQITSIQKETMKALQDYPWPGNVRELESIIERAVILCPGPVLELEDKLKISSTPLSSSERTLEEIERGQIIKILSETRWRIEGKDGAATILGIHPSTLRARMRKLEIVRPEAKE
jgi:PAS domain S-box/PAS domain S-box